MLDPAAVYIVLREQGARGNWYFEQREGHVDAMPLDDFGREIPPAQASPIVKGAAEALARAGYETSRSRTRVHVWDGKRPQLGAPDFVCRGK